MPSFSIQISRNYKSSFFHLEDIDSSRITVICNIRPCVIYLYLTQFTYFWVFFYNISIVIMNCSFILSPTLKKERQKYVLTIVLMKDKNVLTIVLRHYVSFLNTLKTTLSII